MKRRGFLTAAVAVVSSILASRPRFARGGVVSCRYVLGDGAPEAFIPLREGGYVVGRIASHAVQQVADLYIGDDKVDPCKPVEIELSGWTSADLAHRIGMANLQRLARSLNRSVAGDA